MKNRYAWTESVSNRPTKDVSPDVFVHVKAGSGKGNWLNVIRRFLRLPNVGEYFAIDDGAPIFRVDLILHSPHGNIGAELYCTQVEWMQIQNAYSESLNWDE